MTVPVRSRVALLLLAPIVLQACATKGFVRREVAAARLATDSAVVAERDARIAADNDLAARITALRTDLDNLRSEFGAKISAVEGALTFAMPVNFDYDDATVRTDARPMLEKFAKVAAKYYPLSVITVEGFADPAGSKAYNIRLSQERAANVKAALEPLGLGGPNVRVVAYGEDRLVNPGAEKDEPGAQANRRVVFVIETSGTDAAIALAPIR
jgi:outer membrane protein OmpA-like peptidoglycan-associated protein